jgi:flavin-dependent dehydrogenase
VVLERESFPRFHIGESLLPVCLPVLDRLGIQPDDDVFVYKRGAEFVCEATGRTAIYDFGDALDGPPRHAWQVDRAGFDQRVKEAAIAAGVEFRHDAKVVAVDFDDDSVTVRTRTGAYHGRYLVDGSGQNRLIARKFGCAEPITTFGKTAAFVHVEGLSDAALEAIGEGNDIRIMIVDDGWGWIIPLPGRRMSVGLVARSDEPAARLVQRYVDGSALIQQWSRGCERSEVRSERNYSFKNLRPAGPRYACVGDAACFLDPVFSSGVSLAVVGAAAMSDRLSPALHTGDEGRADLMCEHLEFMESGYRTFSSMIDRFYNTRFIEHFIFGPHGRGQTKREIVSVLAGDVWNPTNAFARMLSRSRRRHSATGPAPEASAAAATAE